MTLSRIRWSLFAILLSFKLVSLTNAFDTVNSTEFDEQNNAVGNRETGITENVLLITDASVGSSGVTFVSWVNQMLNEESLDHYQIVIKLEEEGTLLVDATLDSDALSFDTTLSSLPANALLHITITPYNSENTVSGIPATENVCEDSECTVEDVTSSLYFETTARSIDVYWTLNPIYSESIGDYIVTWENYDDPDDKLTCSVPYYFSTYGRCAQDLQSNTLYKITVEGFTKESSSGTITEVYHIFTDEESSDTVDDVTVEQGDSYLQPMWTLKNPSGQVAFFNVTYYNDGTETEVCKVLADEAPYSVSNCDMVLESNREHVIIIVPFDETDEEIGCRASVVAKTVNTDGSSLEIVQHQPIYDMIHLQWEHTSKSNDVDSYYVEYTADGLGTVHCIINDPEANSTNSCSNVLLPNTIYSVKVTAYDASELVLSSSESLELQTLTDRTNVIADLSISCLNQGTSCFTVNWNVLYQDLESLHEYAVMVRKGQDSSEDRVQDTTFTKCDLEDSTLYEISVRPVNNGSLTSGIGVTEHSCTGSNTEGTCEPYCTGELDVIEILALDSTVYMIDVIFRIHEPTSEDIVDVTVTWNKLDDASNTEETCTFSFNEMNQEDMSTLGHCASNLIEETYYSVQVSALSSENRTISSSRVRRVFTQQVVNDTIATVRATSYKKRIDISWEILQPQAAENFRVDYYHNGSTVYSCTVPYVGDEIGNGDNALTNLNGVAHTTKEYCIDMEISIELNTSYVIVITPVDSEDQEVGSRYSLYATTGSGITENVLLITEASVESSGETSVSWVNQMLNEESLDHYQIVIEQAGEETLLVDESLDSDALSYNTTLSSLPAHALLHITISPYNSENTVSGIPATENICIDSQCTVEDVTSFLHYSVTPRSIDIDWILNPIYSESIGEYIVTWENYDDPDDKLTCSVPYYFSTYGRCAHDLQSNTLYRITVEGYTEESASGTTTEAYHILTAEEFENTVDDVTVKQGDIYLEPMWNLKNSNGLVTYFNVSYYIDGNNVETCKVMADEAPYSVSNCDMVLDPNSEYVITIVPFVFIPWHGVDLEYGCRASVKAKTLNSNESSLEIVQHQPIYDLVHLQWEHANKSNDVYSYYVEYTAYDLGTVRCIINDSEAITTDSCSNVLLPNTSYSAEVAAYDASQRLLSSSEPLEVQTLPDPTNVIVDFSISGSSEGTSCFTVNWDVLDQDEQSLYEYAVVVRSGQDSSEDFVNETTFTKCDLEDSTLYEISVRPVNNGSLTSGIGVTEQSCTGSSTEGTCEPYCTDENDVIEILSLDSNVYMIDVTFRIHEPTSEDVVDVVVTWKKLNDASNTDETCTFSFNEMDRENMSTLGHCASNLAEEAYYSVQVSALNNESETISSSLVRKVFTQPVGNDTVHTVHTTTNETRIDVSWEILQPEAVENFTVEYYHNGETVYSCTVPYIGLNHTTDEFCTDIEMSLELDTSYVIVITPVDSEAHGVGSRYSVYATTDSVNKTLLEIIQHQPIYDMIHLKWEYTNKSNDVDSYYVEYTADGLGTVHCIINDPEANSTDSCSNVLLPNTIYSVKVTAYDASELVLISSESLEVQTLADPTNVIVDLSISCSSEGTSCITVNWDVLHQDQQSLYEYAVVVRSGQDSSEDRVQDTTFTKCDLEDSTLYEISVRPVNNGSLTSGIGVTEHSCTGSNTEGTCEPYCTGELDVIEILDMDSNVYMIDVLFRIHDPTSEDVVDVIVTWTKLDNASNTEETCTFSFNEMDRKNMSTLGHCASNLVEEAYYSVQVSALNNESETISSSLVRKVFTQHVANDTITTVQTSSNGTRIDVIWEIFQPQAVENFTVEYYHNGSTVYSCTVPYIGDEIGNGNNALKNINGVTHTTDDYCSDMEKSLEFETSYVIVISPVDSEDQGIGSRYSVYATTGSDMNTTMVVTYVSNGSTTPALLFNWLAPSSTGVDFTLLIHFEGELLLSETFSDQTSYSLKYFATGVAFDVTLITTYLGAESNSVFTVIIPSSVSAVASNLDKAILSWTQPKDVQVTEVSDIKLTDSLPPVVEFDLDGNSINATFRFSGQIEPLHVELFIPMTATNTNEYLPALPWQCIHEVGCKPCTASLLSQVPRISSPNVTEFFESCHSENVPRVDPDHNNNYVINPQTSIKYAKFHGSETECNMHSTLSLMRFWSHCKNSQTVIPATVLSSYFVYQLNESDCSIDYTKGFVLNVESETCEPVKCAEGSLYTPDNNCVRLTTSAMSFEEARETCLKEGGNLAHYSAELENLEFLQGVSYWILGLTNTTIPVIPYMPSEFLYPMKIPVKDNFKQDPNQEKLPGLCSMPPLTDDIKSIDDISVPTCSHNPCQTGDCIALGDDYTMCSCPDAYYGEYCEHGNGVEGVDYFELTETYNTEEPLRLEVEPSVDKTLLIEYAEFGAILDNSRTQKESQSSCMSSKFLHVLRSRCNGRKSCSISHEDVKNYLPSNCPRMVTPSVIKVRYTLQSNMTECPSGATKETVEKMSMCYQESNVLSNTSPLDLMNACFAIGGDLLHSLRDLVYICNSIEESILYYVRDNSREPENYRPPSEATTKTICEGDLRTSLCLMPLEMANTVANSTENVTCPSQQPFKETYPEYFFKESQPGRQSMYCPEVNSTGKAYWFCNNTGFWEGEADFTDCHMLDVKSQIENLNDPNRNFTAYESVANMTSTSANTAMLPGDVIDITAFMDTAQVQHAYDLRKEEDEVGKRNTSEAMLNNTVRQTDILFVNPKSWEGMNETTELVITNMTAIVQNISLESLQYMDFEDQNIQEKTMDMEVTKDNQANFQSEAARTYSSRRMDANITLPEKFYDGYELQDKSVGVVFNSFENWHCILNKKIPCGPNTNLTEIVGNDTYRRLLNSKVVGADVGMGGYWNSSKSANVTVKFKHVYGSVEGSAKFENITCVFWDLEVNDWSDEGCSLVSTSGNETSCECSHLTNLAVIMDVNGVIIPGSLLDNFLEYVTIIGCSISLVALAITILILLGIPKVRAKGENIIRASICLNLFAAELILLCGLNAGNDIVCMIVAMLLHFFFLATFCWTATEAYRIFMRLIKLHHLNLKPNIFYYAFGYGLPSVIVGLTTAIKQGGGYGYVTKDINNQDINICWLNPKDSVTWAFAGPLACILLGNFAVFVRIMMQIWNNRNKELGTFKDAKKSTNSNITDKEKAKKERELFKKKLFGSIIIFVVLGLTWVTGFLVLFGADWAIPFTVLNSLQGIVIFIFSVPRDQNVMKEVQHVLRIKRKGPTFTSQSSTSRSRSHFTSQTIATQVY